LKDAFIPYEAETSVRLPLEKLRASIPDEAHGGFAVAHDLLALRSRTPEQAFALDLIELAERPVQIDRIDVFHRHAVRHERGFHHALRVPAQHATTGKTLQIPEVLPARRLAPLERAPVVNQ